MDIKCGHCGETATITDPAPEALEEHRSDELIVRPNADGNDETVTVTTIEKGITVRCSSCGESAFYSLGTEKEGSPDA